MSFESTAPEKPYTGGTYYFVVFLTAKKVLYTYIPKKSRTWNYIVIFEESGWYTQYRQVVSETIDPVSDG